MLGFIVISSSLTDFPVQGHLISTPTEWREGKKRNESKSTKMVWQGKMRPELRSHVDGQRSQAHTLISPMHVACWEPCAGSAKSVSNENQSTACISHAQSLATLQGRELLHIRSSVCFSNVSCKFVFLPRMYQHL